MNNTLRQLEKNLRTFAKRCKGISYNKTLLFTFLFTGLTGYVLKAAPSGGDETLQQDVNSTILDLRQSFKRTKEQNEKFLENANTEMAQLMMQGEQVVKSNWTSWQFGFGGMFNTQLSRYRGFGGKSDDIKYARTNDLTKYVFDPNQNHWNATTLDIKKNKEPDSKTIDPADVHQGYEPNTVTKLERVKLLDDAKFNVAVTAPPAGYYGFDRQMVAPRGYNAITGYEINTNVAQRNDHRSDQGGVFVNTANGNNWSGNAIASSSAVTFTSGPATVTNADIAQKAYSPYTSNVSPSGNNRVNNAWGNVINRNDNSTVHTTGSNTLGTLPPPPPSTYITHTVDIGAYFDSNGKIGAAIVDEAGDTGVYKTGNGRADVTGSITGLAGSLGAYLDGGTLGVSSISMTGGSTGIRQAGGTSEIGTLTVDAGGLGMKLTGGNNDNTIGTLNFTGTGLGLLQSAAGMTITNMNVTNDSIGAIVSGGTLSLTNATIASGSTGVVVQTGGTLHVGNNFKVADGGTGVIHSGGSINTGTITLNGGGIGMVTNGGSIGSGSGLTISSSSNYNKVGVYGTATAAFTNYATITLRNAKNYGIVYGGTVDNHRDITLSNTDAGSIGIKANGVSNSNWAKINVSGLWGSLMGIDSGNSVTLNNGSVTVNGGNYDSNTGVRSVTGGVTVGTNASVSVSGRHYSQGVHSENGLVTVKGSVGVTGSYGNGVLNTAGASPNADITVNNGTVSTTGSYNNALYTLNGKITVQNTSNISATGGSHNNAVYAPNNATSVDHSTITIGTDKNNTYNTGVNLVKTGVSNSITHTGFNINSSSSIGIRVAEHGTGTTVSNNTFNLGYKDSNNVIHDVNNSVGVYVAPGKEISGVDGNSSVSYGSYNTGILVSSNSTHNAKATTIQNGYHTINGTYSNGIELDTKEDTAIDTVTFNVLGNHSTGLVAGRYWNKHDPMDDLAVTNSIFNVSGGVSNSTSGIYLDNVKTTTINPTTYMYVANASTGIELINSGRETREINFAGHPGNVSMHLGRNHSTSFNNGGGNIGVNIISDKINSAGIGTYGFINAAEALKKKVNIHGFIDIYAESDDNTLFNNQGYADKLEIVNGDKMYPTPVAGNGIIKIGRSRLYQGQPVEGGNNRNTIFANLGYVKDTASNIDLNHIEIDGDNNKVAFFNTTLAGSSHGTAIPTPSYTRLGKIGWFGGTVALQGIVGYSNGNDLVTSSNNVGVYAISGQRSEINPKVNIGHHTQTSLPDLTISDINIGFSRHSVNGTLVYAAKGTAVSVANVTSAGAAGGTSGMKVANTITDGTYMPDAATHIWGYDTPYSQTSLSTTLMRADGVWINEEYDTHGNLTGGHRLLVNNGDTFLYKPSEIKVKSNVDMTSRKGTAYLATNGGRVTVGATGAATNQKHTRASGYESIIAYAQGIHAKSRDDSTDDIFPIVNDATYKQKGSRVTINGGITAADNSIIGTEQANYSLPERVNTYKNIAAYASDNGDILIQKSAVNTDASGPSVVEGSNATAGTAKSLIYGMAAYATGEGSHVVYSDDSAKKAAATVVTGEHGALFADTGGYIEFSGDIVHQNNAQDQITQDTNGHVQGTRRGRGVITGTPNDHTNVPVFYARRTADTINEGKTAIVFNNATNIDMYDGILLAGNNYYHGPGAGNWDFNKGYSDYYKGKTAAAGESNEYNAAKYRGMSNVTVKILQTYDGVNGVDLGLINQAKEELNWDSDRDGTGTAAGTNYLSGVGKYAGGMVIENPANPAETARSTSGNSGFKSTLINSKLKITQNVDLGNNYINQYISHNKTTDPFNNITMESTLVTNQGATITGDVATGYRAGQGLNMANSLYRYDDSELILNPATATYRRSKNDEAGYNNYGGTVNVWGGTARGNVQITGINVANATVNNGDGTSAKKGEVKIDHGYGIAGSDNSVIRNQKDSKITVTGKYNPATQYSTGYISEARTRVGFAAETEATGENYGIVGLSTNNVRDHRNYGSGRYGENAIAIENVEGKIKVDGDLAVGIYAANKKYDDGTDGADQNRVTIKYDNKNAGTANLIDLNNGNTDKEKRDIGIALVNEVKNMVNAGNRGGIITLNTKNTVTTPDFVTKYKGIGIYGESTDIKFQNGSTGLTVETKDDGAGIWLTDDSHVGVAGDHNTRTYNYTYTGANDKKGFGMVFSSTMAGSNTVAENHLNIKFKNSGSTKEGMAGILVNTDAGDWVKNYGKITEDPLQTTAKSFGAVVNKGTFENHGDITLHDSADIKKANVGIFANSHDNPAENVQTHIINYGDIKVGTPGQTKSFGIYGYHITHDKRADGTGGTITIGKESYGVYSGDGNVNIKGGKFTVGTNTVTTADERATGVYIEDNSNLTRMARTSEISADMEIDDYSFGIVVKKNTNAELPGATNTHTLRIGAGSYGLDANGKVNSLIRTKIPEITLGRAASTDPVSPSSPTNLLTNAVYYHSQDKLSTLDSFADIKMNGDYNYAYYTAGSVNSYGNIDLRSNVDLLANGGLGNRNTEGSIKGYGNVGIYSTNYNVPSTNFGTITTGASDLINEEYSAAMAAGHYIPGISANSGRAEKEGYIINRGIINVQEHNGIGMFAVGANSIAKNYGTINLVGNNTIGMYLDQRAKGENYGTIVSEAGSGTGIKGIVAINGAYVKNYGTIKILSPFGKGIVTSNRQVLDDNENSDVTGTQENIQLIAGTNSKTTGDGSTIKVPDLVPLTEVTINGINTPIFKLDTNATVASPIASNIVIKGSVQTGGTRIIDLSTWGNYGEASRSQVTRVGMYVDTSGVRYTNPIDGLENLTHLNEIDLLFGTEATQYTNAKAIELGENILKPYNDALRDAVAGGAILNPISANITWMAKDIKDPLTKLLKSVYLVKVPYTSFAVKGDENTYIFAENLEAKYEDAVGNDKIIFNKLNGIGNGEGHILSQAFDEMKGHQYSNIQQRMQKTSDLLGTELDQLKSIWFNPSKDSNKIKSFGMKGEYKTDTATVKDYSNNAYGVAYVHEFETIRLGERSGFYAGTIYNRYNFKDIGHSKEDQYMIKAGLFKTTPFDENGTLAWTISGDGFVSINEMKRKFWIVDDTFKAHSNYATYGITLNNEIGKEFGSAADGFDGFAARIYGGLKLEYGKYTTIKERGDMPLELKANGYYSARPELGVQFKYRQPVFRGKTDFIAGLGFAFENELGKTGDVHNKARIRDTFKNYYSLTGEKDNKKGNFKSDLQLGLDNQRLGFTVNFGYDTKGNNLRGGLGFRAIY